VRLRIDHRTSYAYASPLERGLQIVRLFPKRHDGQEIVRWRVLGARGVELTPFDDGLGNEAALADAPPGARNASIRVDGEVETRDLGGFLNGAFEPLPPAYYMRSTDLTAPDATIAALSADVRGDDGARAIALMHAVRDRMEFRVGATDATTPAVEALAAGAGVCQDHAHVLAAACRAAGIPARYVSGYLWTGVEQEPASHAWAEVFIADAGWFGLDPANRIIVGAAHVRMASGLDYAQAAPITGVRAGGGAESLTVTLGVHSAEHGQQQ
jgi:transglutaminase-like putative cysteine protease